MFSRLFFQASFLLLITGLFYSPNVMAKSWLENAVKKEATEKLCKKQRRSIRRAVKELHNFCVAEETDKEAVICFSDELKFLYRDLKGKAEGERGNPRKNLQCAGVNFHGKFANGGGCEFHGCWYPGGGCNFHGCWYKGGSCNFHGCIKKAPKTKKACKD